MKKQRFIAKRKKAFKIRYTIYCLLFLAFFFGTLSFFQKMNGQVTNEEFLRHLIEQSNHNISYEYPKKNMMSKLVRFLSNINFENPATILDTTFSGLVEHHQDSDNKEDLDTLKANSSYIKDPYPENDVTKPRVYIYNTHQLENYSASNLAEYNVRPNVMMASYILREKLNKLGIPSMVEEGNVTDILQMNNWNYNASYQVTKMFMQDAKEKNPSLEYFIDMHRDSVNHNITFKTIGDKNYARILFIVGLENPNYKANLALTTKIHNLLEESYPGLSRGIYKKEGPGVNGVYNQDFSPNTILVEMGGVDNNIEEVLNSTEVLADILYDVIGDQK